MNTNIKIPAYLFSFCILFNACIKDKDYQYPQVYNDALNSLSFSYSTDSLPADGSSRCVITIAVLPDDTKDSINIAALNLNLSVSNGLFVENGLQSIIVIPTYKLDTITNTKKLNALITLQSSAKADTAKLIIKYLGVEIHKNIPFYRVEPSKIKLAVSSLRVSPDFTREDTIIAQLSSLSGLPSQGTPVEVRAYDSVYVKRLGVFRVSASKTNAAGNCTFIYDLGDNVINGIIYLGTIHLIGYTGPAQSVTDTLNIYSRN